MPPITVLSYLLNANYGKVLAMGTPNEVQTHPEVVRAYIGGDAEVEA